MRRRLWPYALLAASMAMVGIYVLYLLVSDWGVDRTGARLAAAYNVTAEPLLRFSTAILDMIVPFDTPAWLKETYGVLVLVALGGLALTAVAGLLLLPIFYALYRGSGRGYDY